MTAAHWIILAAAAVAAAGWLLWAQLRPRVWQPEEVDEIWRRARERSEQLRQWEDEIGDPTRAQIDRALDVIAEPDRRRAEHMNRTLRRVEGGDEHG